MKFAENGRVEKLNEEIKEHCLHVRQWRAKKERKKKKRTEIYMRNEQKFMSAHDEGENVGLAKGYEFLLLSLLTRNLLTQKNMEEHIQT